MNWNNKEAVREYMREYKRTHNSNKKYYESHKGEILEKQKKYNEENKTKIAEWQKKYRQENADKIKAYKEEHKQDRKEYNRQYYLKHKEEIIAAKIEYNKEYAKTQMGRAQRQIQQYKFMDASRNGFGNVIDFDAQWIVENIYTKPCVHCGETDWRKLGCNRIDNTKPHTKDNVEPCCFHCNCVLNGKESSERIKENAMKRSRNVSQYTIDGELLAVFSSTAEAERQTNIRNGNISSCCRGARKTAGGFKWEYN